MHAIGKKTQFGEVLYRDHGSVTYWLLRSLPTRLKNEEKILETLTPKEIQQLSKDNALLIKSNLPSVKPVTTDSQDTVMLGMMSQPFSASRDKEKLVSVEPRLRDSKYQSLLEQ